MDAFYPVPNCLRLLAGDNAIHWNEFHRTGEGGCMTRSTRERFWKALAPVVGIISCAKGLRRPNLWAATQAMVNYDHGFTKRGLFGATLGSWLHLERYTRFSVVSLALLLVLLGMLAWMTLRSRAFERLGAGEPVAIFFASYAVTYLAHVVGYLDIPLAILTVGLLLVRRTTLRLAAAVPVCVVALLVHEMFLLVFLPVVLFSLWADGLQAEEEPRRRIWAMAGGLALLACGVTLCLALKGPLSAAQSAAMRDDIAGRVDFPVRDDFFPVLERSTMDNLRMTVGALRTPFFRERFVVSALTFAPTILMLLAATIWTIQRMEPRRFRGLTMAAAVAAALSPLCMTLFGYDFGRWDELVCLAAYLVLLCVARLGALEFGTAYRVAAVAAIALSLASGEWSAKDILMDGVRANSWQQIGHLLRAPESHWMLPPAQ